MSNILEPGEDLGISPTIFPKNSYMRTCRILSVFGYRVLDTWFEGKQVFGIKIHACVQKKYMDTHVVVAPACTYANKSEGFTRLPYKSIGTF